MVLRSHYFAPHSVPSDEPHFFNHESTVPDARSTVVKESQINGFQRSDAANRALLSTDIYVRKVVPSGL
jgi:hypothetical protein